MDSYRILLNEGESAVFRFFYFLFLSVIPCHSVALQSKTTECITRLFTVAPLLVIFGGVCNETPTHSL